MAKYGIKERIGKKMQEIGILLSMNPQNYEKYLNSNVPGIKAKAHYLFTLELDDKITSLLGPSKLSEELEESIRELNAKKIQALEELYLLNREDLIIKIGKKSNDIEALKFLLDRINPTELDLIMDGGASLSVCKKYIKKAIKIMRVYGMREYTGYLAFKGDKKSIKKYLKIYLSVKERSFNRVKDLISSLSSFRYSNAYYYAIHYTNKYLSPNSMEGEELRFLARHGSVKALTHLHENGEDVLPLIREAINEKAPVQIKHYLSEIYTKLIEGNEKL